MSASGDGQSLEFLVCDDGGGFPQAYEPKAFERFSQSDTGRSDSGAGLGLAIVRAIARAHDGEAEIIDGELSGARVAFSVEARRLQESEVRP